MAYFHLLISLLIFITFKPSISVVPDPTTQNLINRICKQTIDFKFCNQAITSQLIRRQTSIKTIAKLTAAKAWINAIQTLDNIEGTLLPKAKDRRDKTEFDACRKAYKLVDAHLDNALKYLYLRDYRFMRAYQALALVNISMCRTSFFYPTPMVYANWNMKMLTDIAIYAGKILAPPPPLRKKNKTP
ncbi:PREDICTED: uncharacterized protein LOC104791156 [Camelina sativa]|uniref:Uncharacterized protein LOC104791156 n=1 Tax=Camelina sativa TaxID=90675 RepID=A0ABM0ZG60_CAMSA|nr:PREDICTED: uncharacterized protein LOC104791156 [Camelina sativa]